ncbi:hypothetical protein LTR09_002598 [Extremus antarcticus]|uniref:rRNA-processing protein FYV7 n=1 Tax=Extremus antarcticus TaxID=702011 RepID=A0AAJ0GFZ5_9PEZI|nr:hypothetical protein LTR09_002598 [Extremus antarcticus]
MSEKRKRTSEATSGDHTNKRKKGFVVGPDNLPDGTYKRKADKIKKSLIERALIKKNYAKLKRRGDIPEQREELPTPASAALEPHHPDKDQDQDYSDDDADTNKQALPDPSTTPHPDRQTLLDNPEPAPEPALRANGRRARFHKPKAVPFQREYDQALQRKAEAEKRRLAREEADRQRQSKLEEREKFRRAMAKARTGGVNGQRKLGRESGVLLERVRRMVGEGG